MQTSSKYSTTYILKWAFTLGLTFAIFMIPTGELFTPVLRSFFCITIFIILVVAFDFFPTIIPAILLPSLYLICEVAPAAVSFGGWINTTSWMIFGAMVLANILEECNLLPRIAYWVILRCGGKFTGIMFGIFFAGVAMNLLTFCQAFILMMVFGYGIVKALDLKPGIPAALLCFAAMLGGEGAPSSFMYNPGYLALAESGIQQVIPGFTAVWYEMLLYNGIILLFFLLFLFGLSVVYKTKNIHLVGGREYFETQYKALGTISGNEKKACFVLALLVIYLFTTPWHKQPAAYGFMILPYLLFLPGIDVATTKSIEKINFGIFFFIAGCLCIGTVGGAVGFGKLISTIAIPILENTSPLVTFLVILFFGMICNLFMTPYAMMAGLSLPFAQIAVDLGMNPMASVMALVISTDMIFMPYEVAPYLLMFGFGMISLKHFIQFNAVKTLLTFVFFAAVMYPLWTILGLY